MTFFRRAFQDEVLPRRRALEGLAVVLLALAAYALTLGHGFVWDDRLLLIESETIRGWSSLGQALSGDFSGGSRDHPERWGYHRPLVTLSYMVDHALWGLRPAGFHLTNLLFHAASTLLVYLVAVRLVGAGPVPVLASVLFAAHPVHTESVAWIAGRTDVMATTFLLLSFLLYLGRRRGGALLAFALALAAKEVAFVYPALLGLYESLFAPPPRRERFRRLVPFLAVLGAYLLLRFGVLGIAPANSFLLEQGRSRVLLTFLEALWIYGGKLLVPVDLSAYYSMPVAASVAEPRVLLSLLGLAGAAAAVWTLRRREPAVVFSLLLPPIALLPVSNVIPIAGPRDMGFVMAERFLYLPSVGFCLFLALLLVGASRWFRDRAGRIAVAALALVLVAFYVSATISRNRVWRDEVTFYQETLKTATFAPLLHFNLGNRYEDMGLTELAAREWREAIRLGPGPAGLADAHNNLGRVLFRQGKVDEAMAEWQAAVSVDPGNAGAHYNLGRALDGAGRLEEARDSYRRFLHAAPEKYASRRPAIQARVNQIEGRLRFHLGVRHQELGRLELAEREWREAIRLEPTLSEAHNNLGNLLFLKGKVDEAMAEWAAAVHGDPGNAGAHYNLGRALDAAGRLEEARDSYRQFLRTAPEQYASARRAVETRLSQMEGRLGPGHAR